jgi:hypothetical protein
MAWLRPRAPGPSSAFEYSFRSVWRFSRVSFWSAVRNWPNCTGVAVWVGGIVEPLGNSSALGVPMCTSTK